MGSLKIYRVHDKHINFYLYSRNLYINRKYSKNLKTIDKLTHYNWWLSNKNRISHIVESNNQKLIILTADFFYLKKKKIIVTGMINCFSKIDLKILLQSLKWQNNYVNKFKKSINIIFVHKKNIFGNMQQKYFNFTFANKNNKIYDRISEVFKPSSNLNCYYKLIK